MLLACRLVECFFDERSAGGTLVLVPSFVASGNGGDKEMPPTAREEIDVADCKGAETPLVRNSVGAGAGRASLSGTRWLAVCAMMRDRDLGGSCVRCSIPDDCTIHGCASESACATVTAASPRNKLRPFVTEGPARETDNWP